MRLARGLLGAAPMRVMNFAFLGVLLVAGLSSAACGTSSDSGEQQPTPGTPVAQGVKVTTKLSPDQQRELDELQKKLDEVKGLDPAGFAAKYALPWKTQLGYDPSTAQGLSLIQASALSLNAGENAKLAKDGFVMTDRHRFPSFIYGYQSIYTADLPVYVSADSILYAVHVSFDSILKAMEQNALVPALERLLDAMANAFAAGAGADLPKDARDDADFYVSVARSLIAGTFKAPTAGGDATAAKQFFDLAMAAEGMTTRNIFGKKREEDFSQFTPRGHYTDTEELKRYFRASMWLGRIDLRLLETQPDHTQVFNRRQLEGALVLRAAMNEAARADWKMIDDAIGTFVGEHDNMTLPQLDGLLGDLKVASAGELSTKSDTEIAQAIVTGGYGTQRISSHIMVNGLGSGTMPLSSTFLLLGQRYVLDSHVFSNVVYDRVSGGMRMMPDPLDVGFAALKNDQAGLLLGPQLTEYRYAPDLASMRILAEAHGPTYWDANLYNGWLSSLQALSPKKSEIADPTAAGLPSVAATEQWGRRIASTQLASWAELRHDTILYVKQSYTGVAGCEYPDAYIDPYPEFFGRLGAFATKGSAMLAKLNVGNGSWLQAAQLWFTRLQNISGILEKMAQAQRSGAPHDPEHLAFINKLTFQNGVCGGFSFDGWYAQLFYAVDSATEYDPVVADVHTQATDEGGIPVGKVLHVGTGMPRAMVVTVESCNGPRAYVGLASSYHEKVTKDFQRLDDQQWQKEVSTLPEVPWMKDVVQH